VETDLLKRDIVWLLRWFGPYVVIWTVVALYLTSNGGAGSCNGVCALARGVMAYGVLIAAAFVTAVLACAQLLLIARHLTASDAKDGIRPPRIQT
jgi:hypothetical protein